MIFGLLAVAWAGVSDDELSKLTAGEVVLRSKSPRREGATRVQAIVDIKAGNDAVWAALLDFPARKRSNTSLKTVEVYRPATATDQWVRWEAERFGTTLRYHNHYILASNKRSLIHELDATQVNDLTWSYGVYTLSADASCDGCTRLDYDVESNFGSAIPGVIVKWLTSSGVRDFMLDLASRSERR